MGSIHPPKTVFFDADLAQLQWVFDEVCSALESQRGRIEEDTKSYIRRRLFVLACNGMYDPETLRSHLLASFKRSPQQAMPSLSADYDKLAESAARRTGRSCDPRLP